MLEELLVAAAAGILMNGFTTAPSRPVRLPSQPLLLLPSAFAAVGVDGCTSSRSPLTIPLGRLVRGLPPYGL